MRLGSTYIVACANANMTFYCRCADSLTSGRGMQSILAANRNELVSTEFRIQVYIYLLTRNKQNRLHHPSLSFFSERLLVSHHHLHRRPQQRPHPSRSPAYDALTTGPIWRRLDKCATCSPLSTMINSDLSPPTPQRPKLSRTSYPSSTQVVSPLSSLPSSSYLATTVRTTAR